MAIEPTLLLGAIDLEPLAQGELSRLCGLYSFLNAIRLALHPLCLGKEQHRELYLEGIRHLAKRRQLRRVLGVGMDVPLWLELGAALIDYANVAHGASLALESSLHGASRHRRSLALLSIRRAISSGSPVLVCLGGALDHYTVVAGWTERRLRLFDSSGLHWLQIDAVGLGCRSPLRHHLLPGSVATIVDKW